MQRHEAILNVAALISDAESISVGLLSGDLPEARFRASLIAGEARLLGLADVQASAKEVSRRLGRVGARPVPRYAEAVVAPSQTLERALLLAMA